LKIEDSTPIDAVGDPQTSVQPQSPSRSCYLPNIPFEIRVEIYKYVFHVKKRTSHVKTGLSTRTENKGCCCGEGLSRANRQIYNETRHFYYNCAAFEFNSPTACNVFLQRIGNNVQHLSCLAIADKDLFSYAMLLHEIFSKFEPTSKLHDLCLRALPDGTDPSGYADYAPLFFTRQRQLHHAAAYDVSLRPSRHSIGELKGITHLTLQGQRTVLQMEEHLLKLILTMEARYEENMFIGRSEWAVDNNQGWVYHILTYDERLASLDM